MYIVQLFTIIKLGSDLHSRTTPHTSPLRASYEVTAKKGVGIHISNTCTPIKSQMTRWVQRQAFYKFEISIWKYHLLCLKFHKHVIRLSTCNVFLRGRGLWFLSAVIMTSSNGNIFRVTGHLCGEFPAQRPVTRSFGVSFDTRLNKRLRKQVRGWWFEKLSRLLWRHCNECFSGKQI